MGGYVLDKQAVNGEELRVKMISDCFQPRNDKRKGYFPLTGRIRQEVVNGYDEHNAIRKVNIDDVKLHYLAQLAADCKATNTKLIFVVSPTFNKISNIDDFINPVKDIAKEYDAQFYSFYDTELSSNPEYFKDSQHLNDEGSKVFTSEMVSIIKI